MDPDHNLANQHYLCCKHLLARALKGQTHWNINFSINLFYLSAVQIPIPMLISLSPHWEYLNAVVSACILTPGSHFNFPWLSFEVNDLMFGTCEHLQMLCFLLERSSADEISETNSLVVSLVFCVIICQRFESKDVVFHYFLSYHPALTLSLLYLGKESHPSTAWAKWWSLLCLYILFVRTWFLFFFCLSHQIHKYDIEIYINKVSFFLGKIQKQTARDSFKKNRNHN